MNAERRGNHFMQDQEPQKAPIERIVRLETIIENINSTLLRMDKRFDTLETKIDQLDNKIDKKIELLKNETDKKIEALSNQTDKKIEALSNQIDKKIEALSNQIDKKLELLSNKIDRKTDMLDNDIKSIHSRLWSNFLWTFGAIMTLAITLLGFMGHSLHWF
jgi:chromosome segregation ATPase